MGEISGAARNKGIFVSLFVCSMFLLFHFFHFPVCVFFLCVFLMSLLILYFPWFPKSFFVLSLTFTPQSSSLFFCFFSHHAAGSFPVFSFNSYLSLPSWLGVTCPSLLSLSPSPSLLLPSVFSSSLQFISLVSIQRGGRPSCCPTVHVCSPKL